MQESQQNEEEEEEEIGEETWKISSSRLLQWGNIAGEEGIEREREGEEDAGLSSGLEICLLIFSSSSSFFFIWRLHHRDNETTRYRDKYVYFFI